MKAFNLRQSAVVLLVCLAQYSRAAELQPATLAAWNAYLKQVDLRLAERMANGQPFLWSEELRTRAERVRRGEVVVAPFLNHGAKGVPEGLLHDWVEAVFIPHADVDSLCTVIHDYDNYQDVYRPAVTSSSTVMTWHHRTLWLNAAIEARYTAHDVMIDSRRRYNVADAIQVREIEGFGHTGRHLLPPDTGNGLIWRLHSIVRYEERDGGVYVELEAVALTRDIPPSLRWIVVPMVNHLSIDSLTATLEQTRAAVNSLRGGARAQEPCSVPPREPTMAKTFRVDQRHGGLL